MDNEVWISKNNKKMADGDQRHVPPPHSGSHIGRLFLGRAVRSTNGELSFGHHATTLSSSRSLEGRLIFQAYVHTGIPFSGWEIRIENFTSIIFWKWMLLMKIVEKTHLLKAWSFRIKNDFWIEEMKNYIVFGSWGNSKRLLWYSKYLRI